MISLEVYRWLHVVSLLMIFSGLVGLWGVRLGGRTPSRKFDVSLALLHGFGMLFMLVAGFGALARLGMISGWPWWVWVKLALWLFMGMSMVLAKRKASWGLPLIVLWLVVAGVGAYLGIFKPS